MNGKIPLIVDFCANYNDRKTPRSLVRLGRSEDNHDNVLIEFNYDGRDEDYVLLSIDFSDLMTALGKVFKRKIE